MTNIQQVNIWVETGAFFDSITPTSPCASLRLTQAAACGRDTLILPDGACSSSGAMPTCCHALLVLPLRIAADAVGFPADDLFRNDLAVK